MSFDKTRKSRRLLYLSFIAAGLLAMPIAQAGTNYRGDTQGLQEIDGGIFDSFFTKQGAGFSGYSKVMVEPVGVLYGQDRELKDFSDRDLQGRQDFLREALMESFGERFEIVDQAGPGVMTIQASLTHLMTNKPTLDQLSENVTMSYFSSFSVGRAGFQADIRDSQSGELLAAVSDFRRGWDLHNNFRNRWRTWGDANDFMNKWASALPDKLQ